MGLFSRLPLQQILVASVLGVLSGVYIFAPGIKEFSSQVQNESKQGQDGQDGQRLQSQTQDGPDGNEVVVVDSGESKT